MNNILVLYPRPQKVKYDYSDCKTQNRIRFLAGVNWCSFGIGVVVV